ncbi:MAG: metallophosphoesterase [Caldilineaceae bacterium]|nr:metallophosphoesterase [Caldilineaceae bacterium]
MTLSVLHISDLHRDPSNPISNQVLLDSLERDRDRYTSEGSLSIRPPDIIVVSGDIIYGAKHDSKDAESRLRHQYDEALHFLDELTARFLGGDKRCIIIVPGNHDVSDHHFRNSLAPVDVQLDARKALSEQLVSPGSHLRWSWPEFSLYRIADVEMYRGRFDAFIDFYNSFYENQRPYSPDPAKQFDIFDFPDDGFTIVGFSSCYDNDTLNKQGAIHPDCIATARQQLRDFSYQGRLQMAVWHHNLEGPPMKTDYMDPEIVQNLIDGGYSLGFHGHQHRPQYLDTRFRHGPDRSIIVISAGTICGSAAYRFGRAYNLVELDLERRTGRLHVREMQNDNLLLPIWGPRSLSSHPAEHLSFDYEPPPEPIVNSAKNTAQLAQARQLYDSNQYNEARLILVPLSRFEKLARPLLLDCLIKLDDMPGIIDVFDPPESGAEAIALMDSLWIENRQGRLAELLDIPLVGESTDPSVVEMRIKYAARLTR